MLANLFRGPLKGLALKIESILGPDMATSEASAIWAQKSRDFQGPPLPMALVMDLSPSGGGGERYDEQFRNQQRLIKCKR
jgi:hypothetical protein